MGNSDMLHRTTVLEKVFPMSPATVFAAWKDLEKRGQWNTPSEDVKIRYTEDDFRIGGTDVSLCLVGDHIVAEVVGIYHDIVDDERIIYTEIIKTGEKMTLGVSQVSVAISASGSGSEMVVTLQTAAVAGAEVLDEVAAGWTVAMEKMEEMLAG